MFYAKPKLTNHFDAQTFESVVAAVEFLNDYNEMGADKEVETKSQSYKPKIGGCWVSWSGPKVLSLKTIS